MILPVIDNYIPGERKRMTTTIFSDIGGRSGSILVRKGSFPSLSLLVHNARTHVLECAAGSRV